MALVEPGEPFDVPYGSKGKRLTAIALSARKQREVMKLMKQSDAAMKENDYDKALQLVEDGLRVCFPSVTETDLDSMNYQMQTDLIQKAMASTTIDEADAKKSESLH